MKNREKSIQAQSKQMNERNELKSQFANAALK